MSSPDTTTRRAFLIHAGVAALASGAGVPLRAAVPALPTPPDTPRVPMVRRQLGRVRVDPYAWLKYVPATGQRDLATMPPPIREHLIAENSYAEAVLARVAPAERGFLAALAARVPEGDGEPDAIFGGWS